MPGTPGTLSTESPVRARKSTTWSGRMPHSFSSSAASMSLFLRRLKMRTWSLINWRASLSAVTMKTSKPAFLGAAGEGGDHVVGLHPGLDEHRHAKSLEDPADHRDLRHQVDGHLLAVGLVFLIDVRAKHPARPVEGRRQVIGLAVPDQVEQVAEDPEDGLRSAARPGRSFPESRGILERSGRRRRGYRSWAVSPSLVHLRWACRQIRWNHYSLAHQTSWERRTCDFRDYVHSDIPD